MAMQWGVSVPAALMAAVMAFWGSALHAAAPVPDAAVALVRFSSAPAATPVCRKAGMEPG